MTRRIWRSVAAVGLLLAFSAAQAGELVVHTLSHHSADNKDSTERKVLYEDPNDATIGLYQDEHRRAYNNRNWGLGWRFDNGWGVGLYHNSYRRPSAYVSREWMANRYVGAMLGLATGYDSVAGYPVTVIGGLVVAVPLGSSVTARAYILPPIGSTAGVGHLTLSFGF